MDDFEPGQLLVIKTQIGTVVPDPGERACQVFRKGEFLMVLLPSERNWLCLTLQGVREFYTNELSSRTVPL